MNRVVGCLLAYDDNDDRIVECLSTCIKRELFDEYIVCVYRGFQEIKSEVKITYLFSNWKSELECREKCFSIFDDSKTFLFFFTTDHCLDEKPIPKGDCLRINYDYGTHLITNFNCLRSSIRWTLEGEIYTQVVIKDENVQDGNFVVTVKENLPQLECRRRIISRFQTPTSKFYLAKFLNSDRRDLALPLWNECIQNPNKDHAYLSHIELATEARKDKRWDDVLNNLVSGYRLCPDRPEIFVGLGYYFQENHEDSLAWLMTDIGKKKIGKWGFMINPSFVENEFDKIISISGYYLSEIKPEAEKTIQKLLYKSPVPTNKQLIYYNLQYYAKLLSSIITPLRTKLLLLDHIYHPCNPSCFNHQGKLYVNVRLVNYTQTGARNYVISDENNIVRTENMLSVLDWNLNCESSKLMSCQDEILSKLYPGSVRGFEDLRLIYFKDGNYVFSCTCKQIDEKEICRIVVLYLDKDLKIQKIVPLNGPDLTKHEKNWTFYHTGTDTYCLYDISTIYKVNLETGEMVLFKQNKFPVGIDLSDCRGGALLHMKNNQFLFLSHEIGTDDGNRIYYHRLILLDENFSFLKLSSLFIFKKVSVEFGSGLALNDDESVLAITYGFNDAEAHVELYPFVEMMKLLN